MASEEKNVDFTPQLQALMQEAKISSFKALSIAARVSKQQILKLRRGDISQMRLDTLLKISSTLQIAIADLLDTFSPESSRKSLENLTSANSPKSQDEAMNPGVIALKAEYSKLEDKLEQQAEILQQEWKNSALQIIESLLLQFPTAAQKARENPQLSAATLVPLVQKPLEKLLQHWNITTIGEVGLELSYNPQEHQLLEGNAQAGDKVKVRYVGYRQYEKLLYRAKVVLV
ncbi:MAG: helix-turn-helix transcriptional regulator [Cyanobacteria bacterium P01_A01_bin.45]